MNLQSSTLNSGATGADPERFTVTGVSLKAAGMWPAKRTPSSPMRKILWIVGIAIGVFLLFTTYSVQTSVQGSAELAAIKDLYFPVLERVDANIVRLDKMEEQYTQAVMTGEHDLIAQAGEYHAQADKAFGEIAGLYPARSDEIARLRQEFGHYHDLASQTSGGILDKSIADIPVQSARMNHALDALRGHIRGFRQSSYDNFVQTLRSSQHAARVNLGLGIALGVMNLGFMAVLVFFIRNNVRMMGVIAEQNATLEQRVADRTAQLTRKTNDINAMLQNMKLGVCTVVPGNRIHPEYSSHLRSLAGRDELADRDVVDTLFARSRLGEDRLDQMTVALGTMVGEDAMMFDFNAHLLPAEAEVESEDGSLRTLQMAWSPILGEGELIDKVLLIVQDVTHLRELERASAEQREELDLIGRILKVAPGKFNDFVASATALTTENRGLIGGRTHADVDVVAALFRNMHTIKGNARTYEFPLITDAAHLAEQRYDQLRKDPAVAWDAGLLLAELEAVEAAVTRHIQVNEDTLGRGGRSGDHFTARGAFVTGEHLAELQTLMKSVAAGEAVPARLRQLLSGLGLVSLERLVSGATDALPGLACELGKPVPQVRVLDESPGFNGGFAEALKRSLVHLVRNSMDHGLELPAEREALGKPAQGCLEFICRANGDEYELLIRDDGRGLPLHVLHRKAVGQHVFGAEDKVSAQQVAEQIFRPGLSTAASLTQISGRGVGMDAVRTFLAEQGASIAVVLDDPEAPLDFAPFRFLIKIPQAVCRVGA